MYDVMPSDPELEKELKAQERTLNISMEKIMFLAVYVLTVLSFVFLA